MPDADSAVSGWQLSGRHHRGDACTAPTIDGRRIRFSRVTVLIGFITCYPQ
jgi:hypothetical protein